MKWLLFAGLLTIIVCGGFVVYLIGVARQDARIRAVYRETRCTVLNAAATYTEDADSTHNDPSGVWWTDFGVRYDTPDGSFTSVAKHTMITTRRGGPGAPLIARGFPIGSEVPCWFDPEAPKDVVLERPDYRTLVLPLLPLAGVVVGFMALRQAFRER